MKIEIAPSILSADFGKLSEEIAEIEPHAERIHFDVMDGNFVPNISFGAPVLKWVKSKLPIDTHLMIEHPWEFLDDFVKAGSDTIVVHSEACPDLPKVLAQIKEKGVKAGLSIKPGTALADVKDVLEMLDHFLVMTVEPGFGGQSFMHDQVDKIRELKEMGFQGDIAVDGGIDDKTAPICIEAGANVLIAGSYIFGSDDRVAAIESLRG